MSGFRFTIPQNAFGGGYPATAIEVIPDKGFNKNVSPRTLTARFGDGYTQRASDGINPLEEVFAVAFNKRPREEIEDIVAFFDLQGAVHAFDLIISDHREGVSAPNEKTIRVVCVTYAQNYMYDNYYGCTATFERTYSLDDWVV